MMPERRQAVMGWIVRAESDFAYAQLGLDAGSYYYAGVLYHCQQTAEKAVLCARSIFDAAMKRVAGERT